MFVVFLLLDWCFPFSLDNKTFATVVVADDGMQLRQFRDKRGVVRHQVNVDQVSPNYLQALVNYEDRYFYHHPGVNPFSLVRAFYQWVTSGKVISGGSTLTMQVARIKQPHSKTLFGKAQQMFRALQLEWHYDKSEILTYYINHAPFGGVIEGVEAASWHYFGHSAKLLTKAQAALLAVLPQAPSLLRPDRHIKRAVAARNKVIERLINYRVWPAEQEQYIKLEQVVVDDYRQPVLSPLLALRLRKQFSKPKVPTFINYDWQLVTSNILKEYVKSIGTRVSAAAMVMDNKSGKVVVYQGSSNFFDTSRFSHLDMVQALRSPGSTLKPFIYGLAIDQSIIHSHSLLMDVPIKFADYMPENFNRGFNGPVSATKALQQSLNLPAVQLLEQLNPRSFFADMVNAGVDLTLPKTAKPNLAMALGGVATNLENLVKGYSAFANQGKAVSPRFSPEANDKNGHVTLLSPESAWLIWRILSQHSDPMYRRLQALGYGTKTGTSYGHKDTWAIAASSQYTIGVWVGRPDNVAVTGHYGAQTAVPLLTQISEVVDGGDSELVSKPKDVTKLKICWPLGQDSAFDCDKSHDAWVVNDMVPKTLMSAGEDLEQVISHLVQYRVAIDSTKRVPLGCDLTSTVQKTYIWPPELNGWLPSEWRQNSKIPPIDPRCTQVDRLGQQRNIKIDGVQPEQIFKLHEMSQSQPKVVLKAVNSIKPYYWFVNGRLIENSKPLEVELDAKSYQVVLVDQRGKTAKIDFSARN